jgi:protocatechuate 3,4-dioxygenase beta subunit
MHVRKGRKAAWAFAIESGFSTPCPVGFARVGHCSAEALAEAKSHVSVLTPRDGDEPTVRQGDGPFFKPKSQRGDLREPGAQARPAELSGFALARSCRPLPGAVVDLWHADEKGEYDNIGFRYRGNVITGPDGAFRFRTIVPAVYTGRTRHYHAKVQAPGSRLLTTQLYFPNEPANARDGLFQRELLTRVADAGDGFTGRFDFVLNIR